MKATPKILKKSIAKKKILNDLWHGECSQVLGAHHAVRNGKKRAYAGVDDVQFGSWQGQFIALMNRLHER